MTTLLTAIMALIIGIIGLVLGADKFVLGSAAAARKLGISPMVVGLTIVSVGTSAPEIIVSINAALNGAGELAVGNAIGSNLANIGLVLGVTALIAPLPVKKHLLREESPVLLMVTLIAGLCLYDGMLGRVESILLAMLMVPLLIAVVKYKGGNDVTVSEIETDTAEFDTKSAIFWFLGGLAVLLISAKMTVWGAREIALYLGVSELVIGLTIIALGTSLPELAASIASALKGHHDIAVGNVFGSNLFNLLLVMSTAGAISPINLSPNVMLRDYLSMTFMTVLLVIFVAQALWKEADLNVSATISRRVGAIFLSGYIVYYGILWTSLNFLG
ncbi:MAG: calcium/sodium antiporter [Cellvibrionales bacterium TMED49]|nr:calcium/sodium antiporter [Porticoccaceae bacterium]OUU40816.1 MAG: calcium/sodium antiporter [Cellvibrionales bacterium TMED49]|tara:strand:+ start:378 stop:1370 length:993 start_codon:yes stop_codon:yes gene_type:complete